MGETHPILTNFNGLKDFTTNTSIHDFAKDIDHKEEQKGG